MAAEQFRSPISDLRSPLFGIYVHVPFCAAKCPYCDFYSGRETALIPEYVFAVTDEISTLRRSSAFVGTELKGREVSSVYFGGGTPSLLSPSQLAEILNAVRASFSLRPNAEITLEANPTLKEKEAYFVSAAAAGINRVSVGMQSANENELKALGRRGSPEEVRDTVAAAKAAGITDISVDLMLGVPGQTEASLDRSLDFALSLGVTHLSVYLLKIEPGTVFHRIRDRLDLPDDDESASLYEHACNRLGAAGMRHYEISNFCFDGRVGRHNLAYWLGGDYLGVGPAAHSFVNGRRFYCERDTGAFIAGAPPKDDGPGGDAEEVLMLALRTDVGLDLNAFLRRFSLAPKPEFYKKTEEYAAPGLLTLQNGTLRLTERGFLVSNTLISELLSGL